MLICFGWILLKFFRRTFSPASYVCRCLWVATVALFILCIWIKIPRNERPSTLNMKPQRFRIRKSSQPMREDVREKMRIPFLALVFLHYKRLLLSRTAMFDRVETRFRYLASKAIILEWNKTRWKWREVYVKNGCSLEWKPPGMNSHRKETD